MPETEETLDEAVSDLLSRVEQNLPKSTDFENPRRRRGVIHIEEGAEAVVLGHGPSMEDGQYQFGIAVGPDLSGPGAVIVGWSAKTKFEIEGKQSWWDSGYEAVKGEYNVMYSRSE